MIVNRNNQSVGPFVVGGEHFAGEGRGAGWQGWPEEMHDIGSPPVATFAETHAERVRYHKWLQWIAARQIAKAQQRALDAGMRIGEEDIDDEAADEEDEADDDDRDAAELVAACAPPPFCSIIRIASSGVGRSAT